MKILNKNNFIITKKSYNLHLCVGQPYNVFVLLFVFVQDITVFPRLLR